MKYTRLANKTEVKVAGMQQKYSMTSKSLALEMHLSHLSRRRLFSMHSVQNYDFLIKNNDAVHRALHQVLQINTNNNKIDIETGMGIMNQSY